jgi:hypothetical protein
MTEVQNVAFWADFTLIIRYNCPRKGGKPGILYSILEEKSTKKGKRISHRARREHGGVNANPVKQSELPYTFHKTRIMA